MTEVIISIPVPDKEEVSGASNEYGFGYCEAMAGRATQEDALAWHMVKDKLHPANSATPLTPTEIGHRLWTSYQVIDKEICAQAHNSGSTAATTVYDGKGNLVTALLADAAAFAAIYNKKGEAIGVVRLNSITHKPTEKNEKARIQAAGGFVAFIRNAYRVNGELAVSRAIGDKEFKEPGAVTVPSEATINITSLDKIKADLIKANPEIKMEDIGNIQIITTCDGYTDMAAGGPKATKEQHEEHLLSQLKSKGTAAGAMSEEELSKYLVGASRKGNTDNISVSVQTITDKTPACFTGVYDGHGGPETAIYVAQNIGKIFLAQCALSKEAYAAQELSVDKRKAIYDRDHEHLKNIEISLAAAAVQKPQPVAQAVTPAAPAKPDSAPKPVAAPIPVPAPVKAEKEKPNPNDQIRRLVLDAAAKSARAPTPAASEKPKPASPAPVASIPVKTEPQAKPVAPTPAVNEPVPTRKPDSKASKVPLVGNEADIDEIARIKKVLNDFNERRKKPALMNSSTPKAREQLATLQRSLNTACEHYERSLGLKAKDYKLITPETRIDAENQFKKDCKDYVKASLSNGLADDLNWGEYLVNLVKCLCNVVIAKVSGNTNQFFTYAKSALEKDVDAHVEKLISKDPDQGNTP